MYILTSFITIFELIIFYLNTTSNIEGLYADLIALEFWKKK